MPISENVTYTTMFFDDGSFMKVKHLDLGKHPFSFGGRKVAIYERDSFKVWMEYIVDASNAYLKDLVKRMTPEIKGRENLSPEFIKHITQDQFLTILTRHIICFATEVVQE